MPAKPRFFAGIFQAKTQITDAVTDLTVKPVRLFTEPNIVPTFCFLNFEALVLLLKGSR